MAVFIKTQNPKNDDFVDMKTMLKRGLEERVPRVRVVEEKPATGIKNYKHMVFIGYSVYMLSDILYEIARGKTKVFLYNLPGYSVYDKINDLVTYSIDMGYQKPFDLRERLVDCWNHREIVSLIAAEYDKGEDEDA